MGLKKENVGLDVSQNKAGSLKVYDKSGGESKEEEYDNIQSGATVGVSPIKGFNEVLTCLLSHGRGRSTGGETCQWWPLAFREAGLALDVQGRNCRTHLSASGHGRLQNQGRQPCCRTRHCRTSVLPKSVHSGPVQVSLPGRN